MPGKGRAYASSSGGVSTGYSIPSWQTGVNMSTNNGSTTKRNCPDVAMVADNVLIVADNGQQEITGGTSTAAPLWAGFAALANQQAVAAGLTEHRLRQPGPLSYRHQLRLHGLL